MQDIYQKISRKMSAMSKSQLKIADYILENKNTVPFFTVGKMARMTGVSEATVVRFATFLGYTGYPELQQYLQDALQKQLTTVERLDLSQQVYEREEKGVYEVFQDDMANMKATMENLDLVSFKKAVEALLKAQRIYIVANRSAVSLGVFLQYYLNIILGNAELLQTVESATDYLNKLSQDDVVLGISFSRYTNSTVEIFSYAWDVGAKTIAITDNHFSPLIKHAHISLTAASQIPTFIDSFVAPLSLINALITMVGREKGEEFSNRLLSLEKIWERFDIFHSKTN
ncbi:MAG TPA: MurR/RpiR family transcriptional regulator [Bacillota bacterium]|nr:MurR/RpiR family transcriptional regulator [Bacillota bacterium]